MQILNPRCCGIDVHKKMIVACVLLSGEQGEVQRHIRTFSTMTNDLLLFADWLDSLGVTVVAMESTGVYWQPIFNLLEEGREIILVNAQHMKAVPGRKTDVKDSEWIADLLRHGLLSPSFIPPAPVRALRQLTRHRKNLVQERARQVNRVHKLLETANVKLGAVATDVLGKSGRAMLNALAAGETDPETLAELALGKLRKKLPQLREALAGRVQPHQRFLLKHLLSHIDFLDASLEVILTEIDLHLKGFEEAMSLIRTLPVQLQAGAATVIAEIGVDMSRFPSAEQIASWAGLCPGNCESAGKRLSGKTTKGNPYLRGVLCEMALIVTRMKNTYLSAFYRRIAQRRGHKRAIVAVAHKLLVIIYHMLKDKKPYQELGADYYQQLDGAKVERRAVARLEQLGYAVTLTPLVEETTATAAVSTAEPPPVAMPEANLPVPPTAPCPEDTLLSPAPVLGASASPATVAPGGKTAQKRPRGRPRRIPTIVPTATVVAPEVPRLLA
jgi:transposase